MGGQTGDDRDGGGGPTGMVKGHSQSCRSSLSLGTETRLLLWTINFSTEISDKVGEPCLGPSTDLHQPSGSSEFTEEQRT